MSSRRFNSVVLLVFMSMVLASCSTSMQYASMSQNSYRDDLYAMHDRKAIAEAEMLRAKVEKAEAEARAAEMRAAIAKAEAELAQKELVNVQYGQSESSDLSFDSVLEDTYQGAYERRLKGFESPTYRMPSSYQNYRYSDASFYTSAYDPSFYNVMVMGDQIWVEPKYVTSMFGGNSIDVNLNFGYNNWWGSPYYSSWNNRYWRDPFWNYYTRWDNYYWGYRPPYNWGRPPLHRPQPIKKPNVVHRPNYGSGYRPSSNRTVSSYTSKIINDIKKESLNRTNNVTGSYRNRTGSSSISSGRTNVSSGTKSNTGGSSTQRTTRTTRTTDSSTRSNSSSSFRNNSSISSGSSLGTGSTRGGSVSSGSTGTSRSSSGGGLGR